MNQKRERDLFEHSTVDLGYEDLSVTQIDGKRYYVTPENNYPSITTVLSVLSEDSINAWKKRIGEEEANKISYRAATRGTAVHELIEKYVNNDPNYLSGYMPNIVSNFLTVKDILDERIGKVYGQELPLYSDHLGVAGRVDCVAEFDGKISIIDYKTSRKPKLRKYIENYFQQEAAYAIMWEERTGQPITQLVTIISVDNHEPQIFIEHRDNWVRPLKETIAQYNEENSGSLFL